MYKKVVEYYYNEDNILEDNVENRCRFCGNLKPASDFSEKAHAVAECIGNKRIISKYECNDCNHKFSDYERHLGNMMKFYKAIRSLPKKRGITKWPGTEIKYDMENKTHIITYDPQISGLNITAKILADGRIQKCIESSPQKINFQSVYMAFLKFALSIIPEEIIGDFDHAFNILKGINKLDTYFISRYVLYDIIKDPKIALFKYIGSGGLPKYFCRIDVYQYVYIIFLDYDNECNHLPLDLIVSDIGIPDTSIYERQNNLDYSSTLREVQDKDVITGIKQGAK